MKIELVVAADENFAIGKGGKLLWHLPDDMKFFQHITSGRYVLMGRKTYLSIPDKWRPLKNRENIIISTTYHENTPFTYFFRSIPEALAYCEKKQAPSLMVIGGGQVYDYFLRHNLADTIHLTLVHKCYDTADTFFPYFNSKDWKITYHQYHAEDHKHPVDFTFLRFEKRIL